MTVWRGLGLALLAVILIGVAVYVWDMRVAYGRLIGRSEVVPTVSGDIEFASGGAGVPVLVVHGSGGGFDQGRLLAQAVLDERFRWIAPSRFGYLRSALPDGADFEAQAHAYAALLDHLGVQQVAVVALSHGGPSALLFAALHPTRVSSLTLISCGVASSSEPGQAQANAQGDALTTIFRHDPLYWGLAKLLRGPLMALMGADDAVVAALTPAQRRLVDQLIDGMNPVSPRSAGVGLDNRAALPNERIDAIRAPTLVFHAIDDGLQRFSNAEFAARHIPGASLRRFERGGHLLLAVEQRAIRDATQAFILTHARR